MITRHGRSVALGVLLGVLWAAPIPFGLYTGRLHLTWGNLSFDRAAKVKVVLHGAALLLALAAALGIAARPDPERPFRWSSLTALTTAALLVAATTLRTGASPAGWLPGVALELAVLCAATGALYRITGSAAGPAIAASLAWMTRTAGITFADGAFEGWGMIVTTPAYVRFCTLLWPLALTLFLTWHTPLRRRA